MLSLISSSSTGHPQHSCTRDLSLLHLLATGHALGHETENPLLPLVCISPGCCSCPCQAFSYPVFPSLPSSHSQGSLCSASSVLPVRGQLCGQTQDPRDTSISLSLARGGEASPDLSATRSALQLWQGSGRLSAVPAAAVQLYP